MIDVTRAYGLTFSIPANDVGISLHLRNSGEFARVESDLIIDYMRAAGGGTYIDVGGNIGTIALPVAAALPQSRVIAVEAQRFLAMLLSANAVQNNLQNVSVLHAAAGAEPGLMAFPQVPQTNDRGQWNYGVVGVGVQGTDALPVENVRVCTLDEITPQDAKFVKIDVEGFEPTVLAGARRLLDVARPCWLVEANGRRREVAERCVETFRAAGYDLFWFYAPLVTPSAPRLPPPPPSTKGDLNFLAVPKGLNRNLWNLNEVEATPNFSASLSSFDYLRRYGFNILND